MHYENVMRVVVTGGAGQIAYSLLPHICSGLVFGPTTQVELHLLDIEPAKQALEGAHTLFNVDFQCCRQCNAQRLADLTAIPCSMLHLPTAAA
eukprot:8721-Heterococcus_DN1.PRE.3